MDFKELNEEVTKLLGIKEYQEPIGCGTTFMTRGGNIEAKLITFEKDPETEMPKIDELYLDGKPVAKLYYRPGTDSDFATSIDKIEISDNFGFNDLIGLCIFNEFDKEIFE